jgi:hypothetical protein
VYADGDGMTVPRALQLVAGRVAQEFNDRKRRGGAFCRRAGSDQHNTLQINTFRNKTRPKKPLEAISDRRIAF